MFRQHFARRFAQSHSSNRKNKDGGVEYYPDDEDDPTRHDADRGAIDENVEIARGQRREINFQVPAQCEKGEDPEIVAAQTAPDSFPFRDREVRRREISREVLGPRSRRQVCCPASGGARSILSREFARDWTRSRSNDNGALPSAGRSRRGSS